MLTYRMVGVASDNDREYISDFGTYSKKTGFNINEDWKKRISENANDLDVLMNLMFDKDCWSIIPKVEPKKMTKSEIEKELGYEIDIEDNNPKINRLTNEQYQDLKKDITDAFGDIFSFWLG